MKILITALLSFLIVFSPMAVYAAEPSTEIEIPEFDSVTGDTSDMHKEIKPVRGTGTTLENCAPGKLKFYSIKGKTYQETSSGKNLIDCNKFVEQSKNGVSFKPIFEGGLLQSIRLEGSSTANTGLVICDNITNLEKGGKYILSGCPSGGGSNVFRLSLVQYKTDGSYITETHDFGKGANITISDSCGLVKIMIWIASGQSFSNSDFCPMLRLSSVSDGTYEPYTGGAIPSPLHPQKYESVLFDKIKVFNKNGEQNEVDFITSVFLLNGIGNVRDEITDSKMIQRIGEIVFDGSSDEGWYLSSAVPGRYLIPIDGLNASTFNVLCTHAIKGKYSSSLKVNTCFSAGAGHFCIDTPFLTLADWKSHLAENPMSVLYELKEPIETELSQADIFNFGWLDTYEGTNYISFVGSSLVPDIEVEYSAYFEKIYDSALQSFVSFMKVIFNFVATEFTIWGFTFSYWQIIVLSCLAGIAGYFIREAFGG